MDIFNIRCDVEQALRNELPNSLVLGKNYIKSTEYISGENVIKELLGSKYCRAYISLLLDLKSDRLYKNSIKHGIDHILRVSLFAGYIALKEGLDLQDFKLAVLGALYHDIGRLDDTEDEAHGSRASTLIEEFITDLSDEDMTILKAIIKIHSMDDGLMNIVFDSYNIHNIERAKILTNVLKDADALDRVRLYNSVNPYYLRTNTSKSLIHAAYEIYANINSVMHPQESWISISYFYDMVLNAGGIDREYNLIKSALQDMVTYEQAMFFENMVKFGRESFRKYVLKYLFEANPKLDANRKRLADNKGLASAPDIYISNDDLKVALVKDTLLHGVKLDKNLLMNIKVNGLVASILRDNVGDTRYPLSVCVYKVSSNSKLSDYYKRYNTKTLGRVGGSISKIESTVLDGDEYLKGEEARFLTTTNKSSTITFIISPFELDGLIGDKLYKGEYNEYKTGYEVPIGIPYCFISGIMVSDKLDENNLNIIKEFMPDKYICNINGELIYTPEYSVIKTIFTEPILSDMIIWEHEGETFGMFKDIDDDQKERATKIMEKDLKSVDK